LQGNVYLSAERLRQAPDRVPKETIDFPQRHIRPAGLTFAPADRGAPFECAIASWGSI
jgi:hypothetical protein